MKRVLSMILVLMFVLAVLPGCGGGNTGAGNTNQPASNPGQTATNTPAPGNQPSGGPSGPSYDPFVLRVHHHDRAGSSINTWLTKWADEVSARTDGLVTIELYPDSILGEQKMGYEMTTSGTCDISWLAIAATPGVFPVSEAIQLPMLGFSDAKGATNVVMDMWEQTDYMSNEYKDFEVLLIHTNGDAAIYFAKETTLNSLADLKGKNIRTVGSWVTKYCAAMGANPITVLASEVYSSFEKGLIDGAITEWNFILGFQTYELCKSYYRIRASYSPDALVMNKDSYAKLPDEVKQIFEETTGRKGALEIADLYDAAAVTVINEIIPQYNGIFNEPGETLKKELTEICAPIWDEWIQENAGKFNSREILEWLRSQI